MTLTDAARAPMMFLRPRGRPRSKRGPRLAVPCITRVRSVVGVMTQRSAGLYINQGSPKGIAHDDSPHD